MHVYYHCLKTAAVPELRVQQKNQLLLDNIQQQPVKLLVRVLGLSLRRETISRMCFTISAEVSRTKCWRNSELTEFLLEFQFCAV